MKNSSPQQREEGRFHQTLDNSSPFDSDAGLIGSRDRLVDSCKDPWMLSRSRGLAPRCASSWRVQRRFIVAFLFLVIFALAAPLFLRSAKDTNIMSSVAVANAPNETIIIKNIDVDVRIQIASDLHSKSSVSIDSPSLLSLFRIDTPLPSILAFVSYS